MSAGKISRIKMGIERLIRFVATDGNVYYGEPILKNGNTDSRFAGEARIISGDVFGKYTIENTTKEIRRLLSPLARNKVPTARFLGLNYTKHAKESNMKIPQYPILFFKPTTAIGGPTDNIRVPAIAQTENHTDYECELVVVIGTPCRDVSVENALDFVFGYAVGNDVSERVWQIQKGGGQWSLGKMYDGWAPFGPAIVSPKLVGDTKNLTISTKINDEVVQSESTGDMIFPVAEAISFLSQGSTLQPGDLIFMGTPSGVGMGRKPQYWLKNGDVVEISLSNVGSIRNVVEFQQQRSRL